MRELQERAVDCPYCGELIDVLLDSSVTEQRYIEDCSVCCRPINFYVSLDNQGDLNLAVSSDDE
ncbi:MAG: CPXCG motif-containing cysteine-rich protein [Woeseiaceae bacterium]|nr:CPXCG motif-containing cysteine-rich protein [Woeseiaceae bacterium]